MDPLDKKYVVMTIVGMHAGKEISDIFSWKKNEIGQHGKTYWLAHSPKAKVSQVQDFCKQAHTEGEDVYCLFINASTKNGARRTLHDSQASCVSADGIEWRKLDEGLKVTGKIDKAATVLVFDRLETLTDLLQIDLWNYSETNGAPMRFRLGASTACCQKNPSIGMKSHQRTIVGWARLKAPFAVYVK